MFKVKVKIGKTMKYHSSLSHINTTCIWIDTDFRYSTCTASKTDHMGRSGLCTC